MKNFTDLEAWKNAELLLRVTYALAKKLPAEEQYGLALQMKRAAVSILGNIAEGFGRYTYADKANGFTIARGECNEIEAYIYGIRILNFATDADVQNLLTLVDQEEKLLSGLISSCRRQ